MTFARRLPIACCALLLAAPAFAEDDDFTTRMMRATVKISHDKSTGTGFVLADRTGFVLVTAAHVFDGTPGDETTVVFRVKEGEGEYAKLPTRLVIRRDGQPVWARHPTEDVAAVRVVPPGAADLPRVPADVLATDDVIRKHKVRPGDRLTLLGYPHREESSRAGFPVLRDGPLATYPLLPTAKTKSFGLCTNTFEGDSGGPVFLDRSGPDRAGGELLLGLVSGQRLLKEELKTLTGAATVNHRFGIAIVVPASFVKETLELVK